MRIWIALLVCVLQVWSDSTTTTKKVQLQSIIISSNTSSSDVPATYNCDNLASVEFCGVGMNQSCFENFNTSDPSMSIYITSFNNIIQNAKDVKLNVVFKNNMTLAATLNPTYDGTVQTSNTNFTVNNYTVTTVVQLTAFTENFQKTTNSAAVVVAVLEGLILLAIIVVVSYKVCFAKNKMNNFGGGGGGESASYSANPYGSSGTGVSYGAGPPNGSFYDGAAAAYRRDNNQDSNTTTMRNEGYGYDQPRAEGRTNQPAQTQNRVQTESPSLVPVPLGGADPLNEWGDQRRPDPFA